MHNINTVIFDVGRVLIGIDPRGRKFGKLMTDAGYSPEEGFERLSYSEEVRKHMTGEIDSRQFFAIARRKFQLPHSWEEFVDAWNDLFFSVPEMEALFQEVAARYHVGLLSDTDPLHWRRVGEVLPFIDVVAKPTLSFDVGYLKPPPKMFAAAAANCDRLKEECLFIDDRIENVDGARYSGMPALLFTTPEKLRKDLVGLRVL
ncbi:MAG: HAD family phosphatase [Planctomycetes bacterium]|nr:HAD family phosphatase [Planctomycetota bacterium]